MARILGVGIATLDIIHSVDGYPAEDSEVRALGRHSRRGGNATNTLHILAQLGLDCDWMGSLADDHAAEEILQALQSVGIRRLPTPVSRDAVTPTSFVALNRHNGSRTIVHYRDLPELSFADFKTQDLSVYQWVHFEGRNIADTALAMTHLRKKHPNCRISLEVEKPRDGIEQLIPLADVLLFSKAYVTHHQYPDADTFLQTLQAAPDSWQIVAWGDQGAWGRIGLEAVRHCPAHQPERVVDTLGAGDVFNAGIITAGCREDSLEAALQYACRLAGEQCARDGLDLPT